MVRCSSSIATSSPTFTRWLSLACVLACGGGSTTSAPAAAPGTERDPLPYAPTPADAPETGGSVGVRTSGGQDQARIVAVRALRAIAEGDERALTRLLAERVARTQPRLSEASRPRSDVVEHAVRNASRARLTAGITLESMIDLEHLEATPLRETAAGSRPLPRGLEPTDIEIAVPLLPTGRRVLRLLLPGWVHRGVIVVRTGVEPRIVGI